MFFMNARIILHKFSQAFVCKGEYLYLHRSGKAPIYSLGAGQSLMYTWDIPHEEHFIRWWVQGERKEKGRDGLITLEVTYMQINMSLYVCLKTMVFP